MTDDLSPDLRERVVDAYERATQRIPDCSALEALARDVQQARRIAENWRNSFSMLHPVNGGPLPWEEPK